MVEKRASKKQRELLEFIEAFIKENEYGPSYREIMRALDYRSVSTVAIHVDGLIARGLLRKKDNSARSLEVISVNEKQLKTSQTDHAAWLHKEIKQRREQLKLKDDVKLRQEVTVLSQAIEILGLDATPDTNV